MQKYFLIFLFFIISTAFLTAQTGTIKGQIIDSTLNEGVIGANVVIEGTQVGSSTDIEGNFNIFNVTPGTYNLVITYIGYKTKIIQGVVVYSGKITTVNTTLVEDLGQLKDVVIEATRETFSEISVISEIRLAEVVAVGISAEQISKSQDRDAAQIVRRIPGINVSDNNFIRIRGLAERYNNVMLHNAFAPSAETDVKSFAFNLIPSSQIDRLIVYKSPAADLPGEFSGGLVKIFTKSIPSENSIVVDYSTQFRVGTTFQNFRNQERGKGFWTGFNTGAYDLPANFPANIRTISDNPIALEQVGRSMKNNWAVEERTATPDQRFSITSAFRFNAGRVKVGNITALTYSNSYSTFVVDRNDFNSTDAGGTPIYNYEDTQYNQNIRVGVLHNWAFKLNQNNIIEFKNLFNQTSSSQYIDRVGPNFESFAFLNNGSYDQVYRSIYTGQLTGKHTINKENTVFEWVVGYNNAQREQPDYKRYRSDIVGENNQRSLFVPVGNAQPFFLGRFYSELDENTYTASFNITQKLRFLNIVGKEETVPEVRLGGFFEDKKRDFAARNIGFIRSNSSQFDQNLLDLTIEEFFRPENINNTTGVRLDEQSNPNDSYFASNKLLAFYGMLKFYLSEKFTIIGGVRVEDNTQRIKSADFNGPIDNSFPITSVLPSVNLTYNITDKMLVRGAYGQTINRPEFRELAPFAFFDFSYNFNYQGNPNLRIAKVQNVDLRWEYYPTPAELVSVALFYKFFKDPIEATTQPGAGSGGAKNFDFNNAESAYNYGLELEIRKSLGSIIKNNFFENLNVVINGSLLKSEVTLGRLGEERGQAANRPLQGQANYILNLGLFYNDDKSGWQVSTLYNVVGRYIQFVGLQGYPDIYYLPRNILDVTVSKNIGKNWTIKGGVSDIINQNVYFLQDSNFDNKFDRENDQRIQKYKPGQVFSIGFSYRIL